MLTPCISNHQLRSKELGRQTPAANKIQVKIQKTSFEVFPFGPLGGWGTGHKKSKNIHFREKHENKTTLEKSIRGWENKGGGEFGGVNGETLKKHEVF